MEREIDFYITEKGKKFLFGVIFFLKDQNLRNLDINNINCYNFYKKYILHFLLKNFW